MISVILPTYNSEKFISEALLSVLQQTFTDYEIIVIDDGSTDRTKEIVENKFPEVRYFYISNQGVSKARNYGIRKARGEFIAFLDADDLWLPNKLEKQLNIFKNDQELMLLFTEHNVFDSTGIKNATFRKKEKLMKGDVVKNIFLFSHVALPTVMVRRDVFKEIGYFEENLKAAEDDNLWMRIALKFKIDLVDEVLVHCRLTENSLSRSENNLFTGVLKSIDLIENKYTDLRERLGWVNIRRKKYDINFSHGYYLFSIGNYAMSRQYFSKSFYYYPKFVNILFILCLLLPSSIIKKIINLKRKCTLLSFQKSRKQLGISH